MPVISIYEQHGKGEKGKAKVVIRGIDADPKTSEGVLAERQQEKRKKETNKTGEKYGVLFPAQKPKVVAFVEKVVTQRKSAKPTKAKKPNRPLKRQLMPEFEKLNEEEGQIQGGQASVDSKTEELIKERFGSYDMGRQRVDFDWHNKLK